MLWESGYMPCMRQKMDCMIKKSKYKKLLIFQINNSPKELRSYIMSLEAGIDSSIILHNEQLRQENKELKFVMDSLKE